MASNAQSLENLAASLGYHALSNHDLLLCLVGYFASQTSLTAQQAVTQAAALGYHALSDEDLDKCILEAI